MRRHFYYSIEFDAAGNIVCSRLRPEEEPIERFIAQALEENPDGQSIDHSFRIVRTYDEATGRLTSTEEHIGGHYSRYVTYLEDGSCLLEIELTL